MWGGGGGTNCPLTEAIVAAKGIICFHKPKALLSRLWSA